MWYLQLLLSAFPWLGPGIAVAAVLAVVWFVLRSRRTRLSKWLIASEALLIAWLVCYLSMTVSPNSGGFQFGEFRRYFFWNVQPPLNPFEFDLGGRLFNALALLPAGVLAVLTPGRRRLLWIGGALLLPVLAEFLQFLVPGFGRTAALMDILDGWQGFVMGLLIGAVIQGVRMIVRSMRGR